MLSRFICNHQPINDTMKLFSFSQTIIFTKSRLWVGRFVGEVWIQIYVFLWKDILIEWHFLFYKCICFEVNFLCLSLEYVLLEEKNQAANILNRLSIDLVVTCLQLNPPASEALKIMHTLAADPGIVAIMNKVHWINLAHLKFF